MRGVLNQWPRYVTLGFALIPVALFAFVVASLVVESFAAVTKAGFGSIFSLQASNVFSANYVQGKYGLTPALWGTIVIGMTALVLALPPSLATAILASDYAPRHVARGLDWLFGILSGIPEVVYALGSIVFVQAIMQPKFSGTELPLAIVSRLPGLPTYNDGLLPRGLPNSALLGGIMLALLLIPFLVPLMRDAIRDVPHDMREAALALGATRWHALWTVVIPMSLPGLVSAATLGLLKASGELVIVAWVVGFIPVLPSPFFDLSQRTAPLTSTAAALLGGVGSTEAGANPLDASVANFTGIVLLLLALGILYGARAAQARIQKRIFG